eukprot:scaffold280136_cov50-Prasinocladus_malaysianus.AAC.1
MYPSASRLRVIECQEHATACPATPRAKFRVLSTQPSSALDRSLSQSHPAFTRSSPQLRSSLQMASPSRRVFVNVL